MDDDLVAERFERQRSRLRAVAYRMTGSSAEADDAVQEAWLRLSRTRADEIDNLTAWLTTVVGRICLDLLRSRGARREEPLHLYAGEPPAGDADPEQQAVLADSIGSALLVVLETLTPTERLAFVLHDMFAVSFEEIAVIVGRSPAAARQLASRARNRIRAGSPVPSTDLSGRESDIAGRRAIVEAFLAASRSGDLAGLLVLLDPDVVMRADETAARMGGVGESRGAEVVARFFAGRARGAVPAEIDGVVGVAVVIGGRTRVTIAFTLRADRIISLDAVADRSRIEALDVVLLDS